MVAAATKTIQRNSINVEVARDARHKSIFVFCFHCCASWVDSAKEAATRVSKRTSKRMNTADSTVQHTIPSGNENQKLLFSTCDWKLTLGVESERSHRYHHNKITYWLHGFRSFAIIYAKIAFYFNKQTILRANNQNWYSFFVLLWLWLCRHSILPYIIRWWHIVLRVWMRFRTHPGTCFRFWPMLRVRHIVFSWCRHIRLT